MADPRWLVVSRGLVVAALLAVFWRSYGELRHAPRTPALEWLLALVGGVGVAVAWIALDQPWAVAGPRGAGFAPLAPDGSLDPLLLALRLFGFVLVVPLMEELFWRSFLMRWIEGRGFLAVDPKSVGALALVVSSSLFALEHREWLAGLLAGLVYGSIYRRSGNLRACAVSHAISNAALGGWILGTQDWSLW